MNTSVSDRDSNIELNDLIRFILYLSDNRFFLLRRCSIFV